MTPHMFVVCFFCALLAGIASLLSIISAATDHWEVTDWDAQKLRDHPDIVINSSYFDETNHFYIIVTESNVATSVNSTRITSYLRSTYGGIWRLCDKVSDEFRKSSIYLEAQSNAQWLQHACFSYITEYDERQTYLDELALSLVRMQNSAASCTIVSIMCLLTAAVIGSLGIWLKQVSVCMVTGVMYIVSGVFLLFALVIMITKISYITNDDDCHSIDSIADKTLCPYRNASIDYSIPIAWVAFVFFIIDFMLWLLLSRFFRLEKAKSMI